MNRKLVNGLLLVALASGGCGMFTSCKDTDDDWRNKEIAGQGELAKLIADLKADLDDYVKKARLDNFDNGGKTIEQVIAGINGTLNDLTDPNKEGSIPQLAGQIDALETLTEKYFGADGQSGLFKELADKVDAMQTKLDDLYDQVQDQDKEIKRLAAKLAALNENWNNLITSLEVNQVWNPIFGTLSFPFGINSTIAASYYGKATSNGVKWPLVDSSIEYNGTDSEILKISADALTALGISVDNPLVDIAANAYYMADGANNLGNIYLTINPAGIDFSGTNLQLVNSLEQTPANLQLTVKKDDSENALKFGQTRADNALYNVSLNYALPAEGPAEGFAVTIDENLKSAFKDALSSPSKSDIVTLAKVLYDQLQNGIPAYAIKAPYSLNSDTDFEKDENGDPKKDENGNYVFNTTTSDYAVYSQYNLAATTFRPFGYSFLKDVHITDKVKLPVFDSSVSEIVNNMLKDIKFNLNLGLTGITDVNLNLDLSNVEFSWDAADIKIDLGGIEVKDGNTPVGKIPEGTVLTIAYNSTDGSVKGPNATALMPLVDGIKQAVNDMLHGKNPDGTYDENSLQYAIQNQLIGEVQKMIDQVNNQLTGVQSKIETSVQDVIDQIKNQINGKLGAADKILSKYNALAKRLNDILADPNHYLQVMGAYEDVNGNLHQLSSNLYAPAIFSGNSVNFYLTSYTGEVIAPSYKKYVAVTGVYDLGTNKKADDEINLIKKANGSNDDVIGLNKAMPGNAPMVSVDKANFESGYTYQVVYSSLDYRGNSSSRIYYITVK